MEIEKKYLVKSVPSNVDEFPHEEIEQAYLCTHPTLRVRKKGHKYIFTYKNRVKNGSDKLNVADEIEAELDYDAYEHLFNKADGDPVRKTRYKIPYEEKVIELDIFHGKHKGLVLAEVEFESVEEGDAAGANQSLGFDFGVSCVDQKRRR